VSNDSVLAKKGEEGFLENSQKVWVAKFTFICPHENVPEVVSHITDIGKSERGGLFLLGLTRLTAKEDILDFGYYDRFYSKNVNSLLQAIKKQKITERLTKDLKGKYNCRRNPYIDFIKLPGVISKSILSLKTPVFIFEKNKIFIADWKDMYISAKEASVLLKKYGLQSLDTQHTTPKYIFFITFKYYHLKSFFKDGYIKQFKDDIKKLFKERWGLKVLEHPVFGERVFVLDVKDSISDAVKTIDNLKTKFTKELAGFSKELETIYNKHNYIFEFKLRTFCRLWAGRYYELSSKGLENIEKLLTEELYDPQSTKGALVNSTMKHFINFLDWKHKFKMYIPTRYSCGNHVINDVCKIDCGSFMVKYSTKNYELFSVEGRFGIKLNRQIAFIADKSGIMVSPHFDLTTAFIKYIINRAYKNEIVRDDIRTEEGLISRVIFVTYGLINLTNKGEIQLLNRMIEDFVIEKIKK